MKCAIHQPQFLPWLGYLHKIGSVDVFVFLDNVQFKKNEFQNRNRIRIENRPGWITVPVSFKFGDTLRATAIADDPKWRRKMCSTIEQNYGRAPYFKKYGPELIELLGREWDNLADLNQAATEWLAGCFEINTRMLVCSEMPDFSPDPTQRLIDICRHVEADTYLSGAGGRDYLNEASFEKAGIKLEFQNFLHPVYPQCYNESSVFIAHLSSIDALFNCGEKLPT